MAKVVLTAVRMGDRYYFSNSRYTSLTLRCDGVDPEPSHLRDWVSIKSPPIKVEFVRKNVQVNHRFELIDKQMASDKIPLVLPNGYFHDEQENYHLHSLYVQKSDIEPEVSEVIDFEWNLIYEVDEDPGVLKFEYMLYNRHEYKIQEQSIEPEVHLLDMITTPTIAHHTKPCAFNSSQAFEIIKAHVKVNIDSNVASADNFQDHITVKKKVRLLKSEEYTVDVNNSMFSKRKPKYVKRTRTDRETIIFSIAKEKNHYNIPVATGFYGENHQDLKHKVDRFLDELMQFINTPAKDCECCAGAGIIFEKEFQVST